MVIIIIIILIITFMQGIYIMYLYINRVYSFAAAVYL
jgi:hypothetical protein